MKEFNLQSKDNLNLHAVKWLVAEPTFNICLIHGLGEHSARYEHVASFFNDKGANVYAMDLRGHGRSDGKRGCGPDLDSFLDDMALLIEEIKSDYPDLPWIMYAHSMGANLSLNYVLRRQPDCKAVIATNPWITLESDPSKALVVVANLLNTFGGFTKSSDIDASFISTDKAEVTKYKNDPLNHDRISSRAGMALYYSGQYLHKYTGGMPVPTLVLHAKKDKLTLASGSEQFAKNNKESVTLRLWDEVYHEMHNDVMREELFETVWVWIKKQENIL